MTDAMEGHARLGRTTATTTAIALAAFGVVLAVGTGLALAFDYVSVLELGAIWALIAAGLSLYGDPQGKRRFGRAALWAAAALLFGGLPIIVLAWHIAGRRAPVYEPNVSR